MLIISCSNNSVESPSDTGRVSLKFDKTSVPENVVIVQATLTKENHDPIIGLLNLLDINSAEIFLDAIPVGQWHLLVEAFDETDTVLFRGETEITILAGEITTVSLSLQSTGFGTGSIYIIVNWGQTGWIDNVNNPILIKFNNQFDYTGVSHPYVLKDDDGYKMWFHGLSDHGKAVIYLANSSDGKNWTRFVNEPVLMNGEPGSWDSLSVSAPVVIKENNLYKMYYTGHNDSFGQWSIGLAISYDGVVWEKTGDPVLSGSIVTNDFKLTASDIQKINGAYYLYLTCKNEINDYIIRLATSPDGLNWQMTYEPLLVKTEEWEGNAIYFPSIVQIGSQFKMVYMNSPINDNYAFGTAVSLDGVHWTKTINNPIFTELSTNNNYSKIAYPHYHYEDNNEMIFYTGWYNSDIVINSAKKY
jgi:predicted GH43/DUF377 family glycosyl hydrolase